MCTMGIKASTLPKRIRTAAGITLDASGRVRSELAEPVVGHVLLVLAMDPPKVTHHDKIIVQPFAKGGGRAKPRLIDSTELIAAREAYERAIPERNVLVPLRAPVVLRIAFESERIGDPVQWSTETPDLDNANKLLADVLAARGYVVNDKDVAMLVLTKKLTPMESQVRIYLRSLLGPDDDGRELAYHGANGEVEALPRGTDGT